MNNLVAKPIIKDQYWVVTDGVQKVGNVTASSTGVSLKLNGNNIEYKNTNELKRKTRIEFQSLKTDSTKPNLPFAHYPTTNKVFNSVLDIRRKLHLYTKTQKSKCYYAAGWYVINQNGLNEVVFCPKYIFIQRYKYLGPFKTEDEAVALINNL